MSVLHRGDCITAIRGMCDNSVDSIVTDPPYELGFMGKNWDGSGIAYSVELWTECLRVLKPGGHLLAFGGTRTYHRMAVAIEDAGFEIRDSIHWTYGSGFPKSLDVSKAIDRAAGAEREVIGKGTRHGGGTGEGASFNVPPVIPNVISPSTEASKQWDGWGTALKPSHEPIVVARKPLTGTVAANVQEWGTGALNIDGCRVGSEPRHNAACGIVGKSVALGGGWTDTKGTDTSGRWPANTILTHSAGCDETCAEGCPCKELDGQSGNSTSRVGNPRGTTKKGLFANGKVNKVWREHNDSGGASRFFTQTAYTEEDYPTMLYYAKASTSEREDGLDNLPMTKGGSLSGGADNRTGKTNQPERANHHPTVKPVDLMRHLVRLVTPPNGVVLDPFLGSGTTAVAAIHEGFEWVGCELTWDYWPIIEARVQNAKQSVASKLFAA